MEIANEGYEIVVVRHGTWSTTRARAFMDAAGDPDSPFVLDYYLWVIRNDFRTILVDTGFSATEADRRGRMPTVDLPATLDLLGLDPSFDGDIVITHGHYDHTGQLPRFPRARIHLARREHDFWFNNPSSTNLSVRSLADETALQFLQDSHSDGRVVLHEESREIAPGVSLILGPGHTPGQLMVLVETSAGEVLLTSDAAHFDEEYLDDRPFHDMVDVRLAADTYAFIRRLRDFGTHIVTGHEPGLLDRYHRASGPLENDAVVLGTTPFPS